MAHQPINHDIPVISCFYHLNQKSSIYDKPYLVSTNIGFVVNMLGHQKYILDENIHMTLYKDKYIYIKIH